MVFIFLIITKIKKTNNAGIGIAIGFAVAIVGLIIFAFIWGIFIVKIPLFVLLGKIILSVLVWAVAALAGVGSVFFASNTYVILVFIVIASLFFLTFVLGFIFLFFPAFASIGWILGGMVMQGKILLKEFTEFI